MSNNIAELAVGDWHEAPVVQDLSRTQIVMYAGVSGDFNPLHSDEVYAREVAGYPSVIAHGQLTMGLTAKLVTDWIVDGEFTDFGVRFQRQVWPGDTLTAKATVTAVAVVDGRTSVDLELSTVNQKGEPVVSGYARVRECPREWH
ncbi:MaoC/PaaZ C-terminal domain-containing protein [Nocardia miyunensis]|uniref:MaoC/PaaZ C-terminal domain-containing protein n=1 Tax=Nocardia miyunensis TaxID=282684 RepID=UPI00082D879B|nr:MaoC/PaaZ C-terminal domain-containing protein [Nocardia miyunensis]